VSDPSGAEAEVFARTIDSRSAYHSDLPYQSYGFNFNQTITALQFGGDWLHRSSPDHDMRLGVAFTLGHTSVTPQAAAASASTASIDTYGLALTGTWQRHDGWYVDGVLSVGRYVGTVNSEQRGEVGRISANGYDASVETGRTFGLPYGIEMEPHVQWLAQALRFDSGTDKDDVVDSTGDLFALTGRLGVRFSVAAPGTLSWRPYMRIDLLHTWMNSPKATLSGQSFEIGKPGSAMELGIGATGMLTPALSIYGEFSGRQRLGRGFSDVGATLGVRYSF
jgi:outer membrane autotransporter protein